MTTRFSSTLLAAAALPASLVVLGLGCVQLLSVDALHVVESESSGDSSSAKPALDGAGDGSDGCAPGTDRLTLENACTNAMCMPFDDHRVTLCTDTAGKLTCPT